MSMTSESKQYFLGIADQWDSIRSGYFTESVRNAAIAKAYLRPDMVVADVGAGTGFVAAGLAPLVKQVYVIDGSLAMLERARQNLKGFDHLVFMEADGVSIPLPDSSLDAVFANMYLHHIPEPMEAIRELARLLRPGGRLVLSDLDTHTHEWMKEEMADYWMGFDRQQIRSWFQEAGLVNVLVDSSGETCQSESSRSMELPEEARQADVSIFIAVGTKRVSGVRDAVQEHYGMIAEEGTSCCTPRQAEPSGCCNSGELINLDAISNEIFVKDYSLEDTSSIPSEAANFSLGCGNPIAIANLTPGEIVLDIGSGGGLDVFLAAQKVGPAGFVFGIDMTPAMLERARQAAAKAGLTNVEFRQGQAEALPVEDQSIDVILSNCVINLCEDKSVVFNEAARVLRKGGRLEISDMVTDGTFSHDFRSDPANWGGCVFGALPEKEYLDLVAQAGFSNLKVHRSNTAQRLDGVKIYSITVSALRS